MYKLRRVWKPEMFQGGGRKDGYFEGWYFKCVPAGEKEAGQTHAWAFIPGVSLSAGDPHAFIQVFGGPEDRFGYFRFPLQDFDFSRKTFDVSIGGNRFSLHGMDLDLESEDLAVRGNLRFENIVPWPVRLFSPGAMGWYRFVPGMENYHGILSLNHTISGTMQINGRAKDFTGGRGYIEKDWGTSFPKSWIWLQTNHFPDPEVSLTVSVATVPWGRRYFTGYITGFLFHDDFYPFSTYSGGKIVDYTVKSKRHIRIVFRNKSHTLELEAKKEGGTDLKSPVSGRMEGHVHESLRSESAVAFTKNGEESPTFEGTGRNAGLEIHGDTKELLESALTRT